MRQAMHLRGGSSSGHTECGRGSEEAVYNRTLLLQRADRLRKVDNRPAEALEMYREILQHEGGCDADALGGCAAVLITRQSTLPEAQHLLERALQIAPGDARVLHALGVAEWTATHNATAAADFFSRATALDPSHARSRCALANMFEENGDTQQAEHIMKEALELLPSSADVATDYGTLLAERPSANFTDSETLYRRAMHLSPASIVPIYNQAQIATHRKDWDEAEPLLRRIFSLESQHTPTLCTLASLMTARHNVPAARRLLDRALSLDPQCGVAYMQLAALPTDANTPTQTQRPQSSDTQHTQKQSDLARECALYSRAVQAFEDVSHHDTRGGSVALHASALYGFANLLLRGSPPPPSHPYNIPFPPHLLSVFQLCLPVPFRYPVYRRIADLPHPHRRSLCPCTQAHEPTHACTHVCITTSHCEVSFR